ncbi:ABC transporter ATP-binding protein [Streptomyces sp. NBC_00872]|uniref:ABC transporter ATP-binding protein n=1 Tax=Streptomyces sp. NBC_00872 TaxID=2903686 RepID=UPI00386A7CA0|nr:ABC transporter ATP-binding protein/permease [Streptomyces sp. NBC_00872]
MGAEGPAGRDVLRRVVGGQRRDVVLASLLAAGHQAGEALVPVLIGLVIDRAVAKDDGAALWLWIAVLAVVYVGLSFSFRHGARLSERAAVAAAHELRTALVGRVLDPAGGAEALGLPGALVNTATEDAKRVGAVNVAVMEAAAALAALGVSAAALLWISVPLGLVVLLGTPLLLWLGHLLSKPLERRSEAEQERAGHASGVAADLVAGLRVLKGIGAESAAVARYRSASRASLGATLRATRAQAWQKGMTLTLTGVFIALVALIGGRLAATGDISLGGLVSAVGLALFLLGPLEVVGWVNSEFAQGRSSAARIAKVLAAPPAVEPGPDALPVPVRGHVRLRGVSYGALRDVDLEAAPGELLGVVATDPADALALLGCLGRVADPDSGTVELDGRALTALDPAEIRKVLLVAGHDADLFEGTLTSNVSAAAGPAGDIVTAAMAAAGADEVAEALPHGAGTTVTERGRSLSGGQRQRVALARALAADAPVLVLHDPTTAVDTVTEARIADAVRDFRRGRTTIMVTTSPALLAMTDRVVLVQGGRVTGAAPHAELVRRHESYRTAVFA